MAKVTVRELRNHGGDVLARVARGESLVVTRDGEDIGELRPVRRRTPQTASLIASRRTLPRVDAARLREDVDSVVDASL